MGLNRAMLLYDFGSNVEDPDKSTLDVIWDDVSAVLLEDGKWYSLFDHRVYRLISYVDGSWMYRIYVVEFTVNNDISSVIDGHASGLRAVKQRKTE